MRTLPTQDVAFVDKADPALSPMRAKGVRELGIYGVGVAITNAVHKETGIWVRNYRSTINKLVDRLLT